MLRSLAVVALVAGCATHGPGPALPVPAPEAGRIRIAARAGAPSGGVSPVAVAVTNGTRATLRLDPRQLYVGDDQGARIAPLAPDDAARRSGGHAAPGVVRAAAFGAATGSVLGAVGGAISGAIQGGVGLATAAGSAVGAFFGLIGGVVQGHAATADPGPWNDAALRDASLAPQFSASGWVYYPRGAYRTLEVLLATDTGEVERVVTPVEPAE